MVHIGHLRRANPAHVRRLAYWLGLDVDDIVARLVQIKLDKLRKQSEEAGW